MIKIDQIDHINRFLKKEEKEIQRKEEKHKTKKRENQNFWGHECGQTESSTYFKRSGQTESGTYFRKVEKQKRRKTNKILIHDSNSTISFSICVNNALQT